MSSALAIAAVSGVLRNLLDDGLIAAAPAVGSVKVTAIAPDLVKVDDPDAGPSLNLFLYRVSQNTGWSNAGLPGYRSDGTRASNPPTSVTRRKPSTTLVTMSPMASIWAAIRMVCLGSGAWPRFKPCRLPRRLVVSSSVTGSQADWMISRVDPS